MTSEKWLDRQVSASLNKGFVIFDEPGNKTVDELIKEHCWFFIWKPVKSVQSTNSHKQRRSTFPSSVNFYLADKKRWKLMELCYSHGSRGVSASLQQHCHVISPACYSEWLFC